MEVVDRNITVKGQEHTVEVNMYEDLEELLLGEPAGRIVNLFNFRSAQLQCQNVKEKLKPKKMSLKDKRMHAFNLFSKTELKKFQGDAKLFEEMMAEKLCLVEEMLYKGEI